MISSWEGIQQKPIQCIYVAQKLTTNLEGGRSPLAMSLLQGAVNTISNFNKVVSSNRGVSIWEERLVLFNFGSWEWILLIKSLVLIAPFLNNRWDPQRTRKERAPPLAGETCTMTLNEISWWKADSQKAPLRHCHKELLVLSLNQHLNGPIWIRLIWCEKAFEWRHSDVNFPPNFFSEAFSNYKHGRNGWLAIMATFSQGSCAPS